MDQLPAFRMEIDESDHRRSVRLFGELDLVNADAVRENLIFGTAPTVVADLSELEFIDSTGLSALLTSRRQVADAGRSFKMLGARGAARRIFEAAGLEDVLDD